MKLRTRGILMMGLIVVIATALFAFAAYKAQRSALIKGIDSKLLATARLAHAVLPADYHDGIQGAESVSEAEYVQIVARWNHLCQELGLEYIWSLMVIDGRVVFTSGTSTSKDVTKGDHALFFEAHTNPQAYEKVFRAMVPQYQVNDDKWGRIRAVLVPFQDTHGRPYLVGASMKTAEVDTLARATLWRSLGISAVILGLGMFLALLLAGSLARPIEELRSAAGDIAAGNYEYRAQAGGGKEIESLSRSISAMGRAIEENVAELEQGEQRFKQLSEAAWEAIVLHEEGVVLEANEQYFQMFGYDPEELIGQEGLLRTTTSESNELIREQIAAGSLGPYKAIGKKKDGTRFPMEIRVRTMDYHGRQVRVAVIRDMTEQEQAKAELASATSFLDTVVDMSPFAMWISDSQGTIIRTNRSLREALNLTDEQLIGKYNVLADANLDIQGFLPLVKDVFEKHESARFTMPWKTADAGEVDFEGGRDLYVDLAMFPILDANRQLAHVVCQWVDITERKRGEEERLSLERQVQHAQKLESLGVLAGGIAHDFNNLLMAILGNADLALDELSPHAPARENIHEIEKASKRAAELAKQMLAYSGKGRFVIEPIHLNEFVEEMSHLLEVSISKKAVLKFNFADNLPAFDGDATQIRQIVMNLITNASEAIGDGSGVIALSTGAMECDRSYLQTVNESLRASLDEPLPEGLYAYLEVADTGCGMDKETIEKIFDPFFTTKFTGRGLGMSAVLGIVRGHRGALNVYSEVGKGTTFKVLFLANEFIEERGGAEQGTSANAPVTPFSGTVLLVDDEETVCAVGKKMLERMGFGALTAGDGHQALDAFREHADEIVCVLLDLTMPRMDGEQAFRELRRINPGATVVLCSGYSEQDATERFAGKGLAGFIQKPYNMAVLRRKLEEILPG